MEILHGIDWLSVTAKGSKTPLLPYLADEKYEDVKAKNGYTVARKFTDIGILEMLNPAMPSMGTHTIYSASSLARLETVAGITPYNVLSWHIGKGHNIARLDLKIDVMDSGMLIDSLYAEKIAGTIETQAKSVSLIETQDNDGYAGSTLYVGSLKKRKKLLRVYDKGAELSRKLNQTMSDYKRIEFEIHGKPATDTGKALQVSDSASVIASAIKGYANFQDSVWASIFSDVQAWKIGSASAAESGNNTQEWLLNVVCPSLARQVNANSAFFTEFFERLNFEITKIKDCDNDTV